MAILDIVCNEKFFVWDGKTLGKCFQAMFLMCPSYLFLLVLSAYYTGFRNFRFPIRSKCERTILYIRILLTFLCLVITFCQFYINYIVKSQDFPLYILVQVILVLSAWLAHLAFLKKLLYGITYKIRGPKGVILSFVICFTVSSLSMYFQSRETHKLDNFSVTICVLQVLYISTFLRRNVEMSELIWSCNINTNLNEREPLMSSILSRYYGMSEEMDAETLGRAEQSNHIFSKILFLWVQPLMVKGYHKKLRRVEDLYDLPRSLRTVNLHERVNTEINEPYSLSINKFSCNIFELNLARHLHRLFSKEFYLIGVLKFITDNINFVGPILLSSLVSYLESKDKKGLTEGYLYAFGLFLVTSLCALSSVHYAYLLSKLGLKIKATIIMMVYKKALSLSKVTLSNINTGEIINFISTDADRIVNICASLHQFWSLPIQIIIALGLLYQQLHYCFLIGFVFILVIIPINQLVAKKIAKYSSLMMTAKDSRIRIMNEIVSGIRFIKMNAWEKLFTNKLSVLRHTEVKYLKKRKYLDALCVYFWASTPLMISFLTFTLYASLGFTLTASKVFTSIALFNILIMPLNAFPWVINGLVEAWISIKRVNSFLQLHSLDPSEFYSEMERDDKTKLEIINGVFAHSEQCNTESLNPQHIITDQSRSLPDFFLGPIGLKLSKGDLICVMGKVGSGKTTLLSSILADTVNVSGQIKLCNLDQTMGIGFVSQEPWIQQKTIKDNILFGKSLNTLKYRSVLESCALLQDLQAFPSGDQTEVGDKGVTLSGGQKARIALARAVYQDFEIYLLDDPLSAVDAHVANHIFSNCIMGALKNKTRILCTHKTQYAEKADYLIVLSGGKIISHGPPSQGLLHNFLVSEEENNYEVKKASPLEASGNSLDSTMEPSNLVQNEEKEEGVVKLHVYKAYWKAIGSIVAVSVLSFCLLMQSSRTVSDWWLSYWVTSNPSANVSSEYSFIEILRNETRGKSLMFYLSVYGGLAASNSIFTLFRAFLFAYAGIKAAISLHNRLVNKVIKATSCFFDMTPLGRIMNRFSSDIYCIDDALPFMLNIFLAQIFGLVGCVAIICYGLPLILMLIAILSFAYWKLQLYYRHTSRELKRLSSISLSPIYAHFSESMNGHSTIRAMSACSRFQRENMEYIDSNLQACLATTAASQWLNLRLQCIGLVTVTAVALLALLEKQYGDVNPGLVGLALTYALSLTALLNGSITSFTETEKEIVSVERVMQYIENIPSETEVHSQLPPFSWPTHGVIAFSNVCLRYRPTCPYALENISFETRPGEKIGVVGRTGSGKSSLLQVLFCMVDHFEGTVNIDGVNITKLKLGTLRSKMFVIPQTPFLFSGTIRDNLDPCHLKSDSEIWRALRECHLEEKVNSVGGLDVEVEEQGQNFSNGERQLICLTRALLCQTKILCMDEATASIDSHTDSLIRHTVRMAFRRSTLIIIAHRMETVLDCDRVILMKEGQIAEIGEPSSLLANKGTEFSKLVSGKR